MSRVKGICMGDCSICKLLAAEEVEMIPCILDQMFQRIQKNEKEIATILEKVSGGRKVSFSGVEPLNDTNDVQEND